jgi:hypothetical protein
MKAHTSTLAPRQVDFLYWHAVSKMRMADFEGANTLFRLLHAACPERTDTALGRIYCLVRLGELEAASGTIAMLRRRPLRPDEMGLLGRLHRRCEFERARLASRQRLASGAGSGPGAERRASPHAGGLEPVRMPHTLGDDAMARQSADQR